MIQVPMVGRTGPELRFCAITFRLARTVSTQFVNSPPPLETFRLYGGTGVYRGWLGSANCSSMATAPARVTFRFDD